MSNSKETTSKVKDTTEQAREKASEMADWAQEQARSQAATQKERAVDQLSGVAQALRSTSNTLREEDDQTAARYADQVAGRIERVSDYLRDRSTGDLLRDTEHFARRQTAVFLGGAFALGLLGARFLKSSNSHRSVERKSHNRRPGATTSGRQTSPSGSPTATSST